VSPPNRNAPTSALGEVKSCWERGSDEQGVKGAASFVNKVARVEEGGVTGGMGRTTLSGGLMRLLAVFSCKGEKETGDSGRGLLHLTGASAFHINGGWMEGIPAETLLIMNWQLNLLVVPGERSTWWKTRGKRVKHEERLHDGSGHFRELLCAKFRSTRDSWNR